MVINHKFKGYNIALLFFFSILSLLIAEGIMRFHGDLTNIDYRIYMKELKNTNRLPAELYILDPVLTVRLKPNVSVLSTTSDFSIIYKINSQGFRDKEYLHDKPENIVRILALGDSFTFGEGIKYGDRFTDIAESYYPNIEIINLGIPGCGLDQALLLCVHEGVSYSPDYIFLFINNLIITRYSTNIYNHNQIILENATSTLLEGEQFTLFLDRNNSLLNEKNNFLLENSFFLNYLDYHLKLILLRNDFKEFDKKEWEDIIKNEQEFFKTLDQEELVKRTKLIITKFNEISEKQKSKLIIINIDDEFSLNFINEMKENITYYDLSKLLKEEGRKYSLTFKYDQHYNKKTNELIAQELIEIISTLN